MLGLPPLVGCMLHQRVLMISLISWGCPKSSYRDQGQNFPQTAVSLFPTSQSNSYPSAASKGCSRQSQMLSYSEAAKGASRVNLGCKAATTVILLRSSSGTLKIRALASLNILSSLRRYSMDTSLWTHFPNQPSPLIASNGKHEHRGGNRFQGTPTG